MSSDSKKRYVKKDPIDHILLRPDMYVGSNRLRELEEYVAEKNEEGTYSISREKIKSSPAMLRIFVEPLSNAIDNVERSKKTKTPCTKIKITINPETGETSIWNDGDIVPIEIDNDENCYNHSMIFGQLLTGSNYDDEEERIISGRNGLGVKLTNIFSETFTVKGCDPKNGKILEQTWTNNMRNTDGPKIKSTKLKKGYTEVSWIPQFKHFKLKNYTPDIVKHYTRYVIDASILSGINVYLNDELVNIKTLQDYSSLYEQLTDEKLFIKTKEHQVLLTTANEFQNVSFVNGVYTRLGGNHVDSWLESLLRPIVDIFNNKNKKTKSPKINISDVKQFFRIFVVSTIIRPEFDGQDKNKLESPPVEADVKKTHISTISKWSVMDKIQAVISSKEMLAIKKTERTTKTKIDGYDPANKCCTKDSYKCSLFITEGLSAKTYVVAGIKEGVYGKKGRDWNGVLPVRGKLLNVRDKTSSTIINNKVITSIIQALGLKYEVDYTVDENYKKLNYGRLIIVADADVDGIHIEGLILNFFHALYPTLLGRDVPFVVSMKTPICRIIKKGKGNDILFYDESNFRKWLNEQTSKVNVKYYKGLGTTKAEDVPDTFGLKMLEFQNDDNSFTSMNKAFHKDKSEERKQWLAEYNPDVLPEFSLDKIDKIAKLSLTNFVDLELIKFSHADCMRSIPSMIDGLKESQRKILYAVFKRKLKYNGKSLKVAQLAGYTAEHSNYHHGEKNLYDTIIGMANEFPGTNNIPLLYRDGMFGTRLEGADDAADGRYIFTKMDQLTELIYREEDTPLLEQVNDDGDLVQPRFYIPIIPMILVNGCTAGIGTGWSTKIPCYNPEDIINGIKLWLSDKFSDVSEFTPWYRGYHGKIEKDSDSSRYTSYGILEPDRTEMVIKELPIGVWTSKYADFLTDMKNDKNIKSVSNYSTPKDVRFVIKEVVGKKCTISNMKLTSYIHVTNMVMFNEHEQLKKYETVLSILDDFCKIRYEYYVKRKKYQINTLEKKIRHLKQKSRFIGEVIDETIPIMKSTDDEIVSMLKERKYDVDPYKEEGEGSYDYLLRISVRELTTNKKEKLENDIRQLVEQLNIIKKKKEKDIWLEELNELEKQYTGFRQTLNK